MKNKILIAMLATVILITLAGCGHTKLVQNTTDTPSASITSDTETSDDAAEKTAAVIHSEITTEKETTVPQSESVADVSTQNNKQASSVSKQDIKQNPSVPPKSTESLRKPTTTVTEKPAHTTAPSVPKPSTTESIKSSKPQFDMVSFPRENDAKVDYSGTWGHKAQNLMNGWSLHESRYTTFFTMDDYGGKICYCIEPGTPAANGNEFTQKDESFWDNYPSQYNKTIDADIIKLMVGRILQYGFTGDVELTWVSQNSDGAKKIAQAAATQALIWETIVGERDENFNHVDPGSKAPVLSMFEKNHPLRSLILSYYDDIVSGVQKHSKLPSFCSRSTGKAKEIELEWNGSQYTAMLTDSNGVLGDYSFSSNDSNLKFSVSGNKLTITTSTAPSDTVSITASRKNSQRKGLIVWNDGKYAPGDGQQDLVSYTQSVNDPVKGYVKIKVSYGSAKIVKTSEDGKVDGVSFRVQGNGVDKTVKTANGGQIQIDNLMPGVYTVTEQTENKYEPQETRRVTIVSGQTATVTFSNKLKRGNLTVTKTSEDGLNEGIKFRLYGTSLSGLKVDEYAVTDKSGKAYFKDVLIGSGYTIEEVDTAIRYVVPEKQTADVEWNKVTNKSFNNILKKWNLTVTKSDSEKGLPQGDASLAGAKYGIYKGEQLIDTYQFIFHFQSFDISFFT